MHTLTVGLNLAITGNCLREIKLSVDSSNMPITLTVYNASTLDTTDIQKCNVHLPYFIFLLYIFTQAKLVFNKSSMSGLVGV